MTRIDFAEIRDRSSFESVLSKYGLAMRGGGSERTIRCPFHDDGTPSCSVNLEKKVFVCFACGEKGTILDFVARMEPCSIAEAARLLAGWSDGPSPSPMSAGTAERRPEPEPGNEPLRFVLPLDPRHPYLAERGVSQETVARFGLGFCDRGVMKGRICIPIHDEGGRLVAYAGRWPGTDMPDGEPRYRLPKGFRKRSVLFNFHRVAAAPHLAIVEGYWSVFRLDAIGIPSVALMGRTLSEEQETILARARASRLTLLLDGDEPGRASIPDILSRLARHRFVHAPDLSQGAQPDTMGEDELLSVFRASYQD